MPYSSSLDFRFLAISESNISDDNKRSDEVKDPQDSRFRIAYAFHGHRIPENDILSAVLDAILNTRGTYNIRNLTNRACLQHLRKLHDSHLSFRQIFTPNGLWTSPTRTDIGLGPYHVAICFVRRDWLSDVL